MPRINGKYINLMLSLHFLKRFWKKRVFLEQHQGFLVQWGKDKVYKLKADPLWAETHTLFLV